MLSAKDYIRERKAIQKKIASNEAENKKLKLQLAPLNRLIAAAGVDLNGDDFEGGLGDEVDELDQEEWFDCTVPGCDRKGEYGFGSKQARGVHLAKGHGITKAKKAAKK